MRERVKTKKDKKNLPFILSLFFNNWSEDFYYLYLSKTHGKEGSFWSLSDYI